MSARISLHALSKNARKPNPTERICTCTKKCTERHARTTTARSHGCHCQLEIGVHVTSLTHRWSDKFLVRHGASKHHTNFLYRGMRQSKNKFTCASLKKECFSPKRETIVGLASCLTENVLDVDRKRVRLVVCRTNG